MNDPTTEGFAWVDGRVLPLSEARIPILDRAYLLGDGVFETMRTFDGRIFQEDRHAVRLARGVATLGLPAASAAQAMSGATQLVRSSSAQLGPEGLLRVQVSVGAATELVGDLGAWNATAIVRPFQPYPSYSYTRGVRLRVSALRLDSNNPLSNTKTLSFLPRLHARREAAAAGSDDAVLLNQHGRVAEATTSNVVARVGGTLHAPGPLESALDGVTRALVLEDARSRGFPTQETLTLEGLASATEIFLTNTVAGVVPVTEIRGDEVTWTGIPGPATAALQKAYNERLVAFRIAESAVAGPTYA